MAKTSPTVRGRIVELHELGLSSRQIAKKYHCSHSTVLDILRRYNQTGSCRNRPKPGRPRALSPSTTHHDYMLIRRGKVHNATDLQRQFHPKLSARTVQRELRRAGLRACVPRKVPFLTHRHKQVRLVFARHTREWGPREWKVIIFSDETKLNLLSSDGRDYVWRKPGEAYRDNNTVKTKKYGGGSLMLWGCITSRGVGRLHRIDGIMDSQKYIGILAESFLGTLADHGMDVGHVILQQDGDSKHTSKQTQRWLKDNNIKTLPWPAQSPDLNIIEHVWDYLKRRVHARSVPVRTLDELWAVAQEEWCRIPKQFIQKLYNSLPDRVAEVIEQKGSNTRY